MAPETLPEGWLDDLEAFLAIPSVNADRGIPTIMARLALPRQPHHSPNERMLLETFPLGVAAARETYRALGGLSPSASRA